MEGGYHGIVSINKAGGGDLMGYVGVVGIPGVVIKSPEVGFVITNILGRMGPGSLYVSYTTGGGDSQELVLLTA